MGKRNDLIFDEDQYPLIKKFDGQRVHPKDLRPDPVLNGRVELPNIAKFKADFLVPEIGQIQPITICKLDGIPTIIDGVSRWRAAMEITNEGIGPHEGGAFFLKCAYSVAKTPMARYLLTVKANIRNDPKPADVAHSIAIFLHQFQQSEEYIAAEVYARYTLDGKPDVGWVRECNALNDLTPNSIEAIKAGKVKSKAAVALSKLTPERQLQKIAELRDGQQLTVAAIKRAVAPAPQSDTPETPARSPRHGKWDLTAFRKLVESHLSSGVPDHVKKKSCDDILREVLGSILDALDEPPAER